jgi:peptidyl-prolyl cis-trans isomerase SurA
VNGEPITALDVDQRIKLLQVSTRRSPPRPEVIEELINERIKLQQAARQDVLATDAEVDRIFAQIAQGSGRKPADFAAGLTQAGIDLRRLKTRIRAEISWRQVLQRRRPFLVRDADIVAALTARGQSPQITVVQYTLRQFIFVVPRGSPEPLRAARIREAEAFRKAFPNCLDGVALGREQREVVVKDPVVRISTDLAPRLRELLEKTQTGTLTPPEPVSGGIEVVAVCDRKDTIADVSSRREVRDELMSQRLQLTDKQLLDEFRKGSIIEYRNATEPRPRPRRWR